MRLSFMMCLIWGLVVLGGWLAEAKTFSNSYVSFELPPKWKCAREGTEYVCNHPDAQIKKQAVIIVTAKQVGPSDNLTAYEAHLKQTKPMGPQKPTKILHTKRGPIHNHEWVDGLQLDSEVKNFYTRYLATLKGGLAILVTFSAARAHYSQFAPHFNRAVASLRVLAAGSLKGAGEARRQTGSILGQSFDMSGLDDDDELGEGSASGGWLSDPASWLGLLLVAGAIGFILWRRRRK